MGWTAMPERACYFACERGELLGGSFL
jgi:hypothetical protein